ncbi:hypothetical protein NA57DRAFT_81705 [Rhizodiscina lignyota]|uniref:Uncharacterized protein n=1 Tax=Rhizodiscina lignyota TaxID=1504668 RepID=A0A9P4M4P5_9PEZI|nr:hypothetical protein NA57DRAFT_81705 [Rhizodiscina lignyota]
MSKFDDYENAIVELIVKHPRQTTVEVWKQIRQDALTARLQPLEVQAMQDEVLRLFCLHISTFYPSDLEKLTVKDTKEADIDTLLRNSFRCEDFINHDRLSEHICSFMQNVFQVSKHPDSSRSSPQALTLHLYMEYLLFWVRRVSVLREYPPADISRLEEDINTVMEFVLQNTAPAKNDIKWRDRIF